MSYREDVEQLMAEAPAIMRAAIEEGKARPGPKVDRRQLTVRHRRTPQRYPQLRRFKGALYQRNENNLRYALANGTKFKPLLSIPKPRPGEMYLKEWIASQAERLGLGISAAWMRYNRGKIRPSGIRRVTKRTIFVRP